MTSGEAILFFAFVVAFLVILLVVVPWKFG